MKDRRIARGILLHRKLQTACFHKRFLWNEFNNATTDTTDKCLTRMKNAFDEMNTIASRMTRLSKISLYSWRSDLVSLWQGECIELKVIFTEHLEIEIIEKKFPFKGDVVYFEILSFQFRNERRNCERWFRPSRPKTAKKI